MAIETGDNSLLADIKSKFGGQHFNQYLQFARLDPREVNAAVEFSEILNSVRNGGDKNAAKARLAELGNANPQVWVAFQQLIADIDNDSLPTGEELKRFARSIYTSESTAFWGRMPESLHDECRSQRCKNYARLINLTAKPGKGGGEIAQDTAITLVILAAEIATGEVIGLAAGRAIEFVSPTVARYGGKFFEKVAGAWRPISSNIPKIQDVTGHTLIAFENFGGHTIARHVGKSNSDLVARLAKETNIPMASTFPDIATASNAVSSTVANNHAVIKNWLSGTASRLEINSTLGFNVGKTLSRGSSNPVSTKKTTVILKRDSLSKNGYTVLTSFPDL